MPYHPSFIYNVNIYVFHCKCSEEARGVLKDKRVNCFSCTFFQNVFRKRLSGPNRVVTSIKLTYNCQSLQNQLLLHSYIK